MRTAAEPLGHTAAEPLGHTAARQLALTAAQLVAVAAVVVALRGRAPAPGTRHPIGGSPADPFLVYTAAVLAAVLMVFAAARFPRPVRRGAPRAGSLSGARVPWRIVAAVVLVLAVLLIGAPLLAHFLPHWSTPAAPPAPSAPVSPPSPSPTETPPAPGAEHGTNLLPTALVVAPVLLVLLAAGALIAGRKRPFGTAVQSRAPDVGHPPLSRAAELGLAAISEPALDPGAAIVACYVAMEQALAQTPDTAPRAADTPSEILARAVEHGALHPEAATTLVELFAEARFSRHRIGEDQRQAAVAALHGVLDELQGAACVSSP